MTGCYPWRFGLQTVVIPSKGTYGLAFEERTLPEILRESGYRTAMIGKWHLGHADRNFWPRQRGLDYHYDAVLGEIDYFTHDAHGVVDWQRDNKAIQEKGYATELLGNDAVKLISNYDEQKPLFLYLAFTAPHAPYQAPAKYVDRFAHIADETRRTYAGMVSCLDDQIGEVVAALEKKGMMSNTLILFHSDNGGTRDEIVYNIEPFRGAVRDGSWKLIWTTLLPGKVELYNLDEDPLETQIRASEQPAVVEKLKHRIETLVKESVRPLFFQAASEAVFSGVFGPAPIPTDEESVTAEP